MRLRLRPNWYRLTNEHAFDLDAAGIYEWRIEGIGLYIGKAKRLRSRIRAYPNNVRRMIEGLPWHGNPNKSYRPVHQELRSAYEANIVITLAILENCSIEDRAARERAWIKLRREEESFGGLCVLNAT